ncbi:MAG: hypothetical protein JKP92_08645 [Alphaproteobacteria bacterium]|jgi:hypothetical protein|nr:hypothetical protein [Alphaproteobacteria bacterium]
MTNCAGSTMECSKMVVQHDVCIKTIKSRVAGIEQELKTMNAAITRIYIASALAAGAGATFLQPIVAIILKGIGG